MNKKVKTLALIPALCANLFDITIKEEDMHQFINICDNQGYDELFFGKFTKNKL
tara:strand:- start:136 stop:297 length:162 start_codon:yes stop_codon:yes gene_type:complete